jgi:FkbM family methyltransferase
MGVEHLKKKVFRFQNSSLIALATLGLISRSEHSMSFIGNSYSGYWFLDEYVHSRGTIWGVGLGMDSSFETQLGKKGFKVFGFEPDKSCIAHAKVEFEGIDSKILPYGLWDRNGEFESYGQSISLFNIFENSGGNGDSLQIRDIHEISENLELNLQKSPRVLKMNIEGAEREILHSMISKPLNFEIIIFQAEFLLHLGFLNIGKKIRATAELRSILKGLARSGYLLVHTNQNQFTLLSKTVVI